MRKSPWEDDDNTRDESSVFFNKKKKPIFSGPEFPELPQFEPRMIISQIFLLQTIKIPT